MTLLVLYLTLLKATALSFSGFASVPVLREDLVVARGVLTDEQLNSAIAISQASPGPLGLYLVAVGYFVAGFAGAIDGLQLSSTDDRMLLDQGMTLFEALYRSFGQSIRPSHPRPVVTRKRKSTRPK